MHGSKLSLIVVFMFSGVAARLIPNGDVDKEHNSDDQERLDRQDYTPHMIRNTKIHKPAILATGICAQSPNLPCCKETIAIYKILSRPVVPRDIEYPDCRSDGYYAAKQCDWFGCFCVDPNGNSGPPTQPGDFNIICPDELMGGGKDIALPGHHHRAAHGCVQWGEPCTRETDCCGDSNYEGICERFLCNIKVKASAKKIKGRKGLQRRF